jgi:AraC-like DNA-binding protein
MERPVSGVTSVPYGYAEHEPPADLAPYVLCIWTGRRPPNAVERPEQRVLPDGCVDIIVSFGSSASAVLVGPMSRPLTVAGAGPELYVGARFRPGRALSALRMPAAELLDETIHLENANYRTLYGAIDDVLNDAEESTRRFAAAVAFVRERICGAQSPPPSVRAAVRSILVAQGNLRVASLAAEIGITRQQLARQFATHVGLSPKLFARVMRAQAVIARMGAAEVERGGWSEVALELGYYDQPHFIDDFKALTGTTPAEWSAISRPFLAPASMP